MTLFELIFILLFLGSVVGLILSCHLWRRRRLPENSGRLASCGPSIS